MNINGLFGTWPPSHDSLFCSGLEGWEVFPDPEGRAWKAEVTRVRVNLIVG